MGRQAALCVAAALLIGLEFGGLRVLEQLDLMAGDVLLRHHAEGRSPDPRVILIAIDEHSLDAMAAAAGRYPWPRSVHAQLIEYLDRQGAAAIVFDILFSDPDIDRPDGDTYLFEAAQKSGKAYFPFVLLEGEKRGIDLSIWGYTLGFTAPTEKQADARAPLVLPLRPLASTGRIGSINFLIDSDGRGRRIAVRTRINGWQLPSLPARVVADLGTVMPGDDAVRINWRGKAMSRTTLPYADVHADAERRRPQIDAASLADKIIVIGGTAPALSDLRNSALEDFHPGSDILAAGIETLLNEDWLRPVPATVLAALSLALCTLILLGFRLLPSPPWVGGGLFLASLALVAASALALPARWSLPVASPLLLAWLFFIALALDAWIRERKQRARAVQLFGRFVDPRVVSELVSGEEQAGAAGGERRRITLLFSDIRGFTTLSESRSPEAVVKLLNTYFSRQVDVIFRHGGTIDKFIGDAIMAFWGAPLADDKQAEHAVAAALEMSQVVDAMRSELAEGSSDFDIGIGIHSGEAVVGFIGAEHRLEYTAIGDTVNLASRIEGLTKGLARILVSQATRDACGDHFDFAQRGSYKVKGRSAEVVLYEPLSPGN